MSASSPVVLFIIPHTTQCTKVPPGASGSTSVSAWLCQPCGGADQVSGGFTPFNGPSHVNLAGSLAPLANAGLVSFIVFGGSGADLLSSPPPHAASPSAAEIRTIARNRIGRIVSSLRLGAVGFTRV